MNNTVLLHLSLIDGVGPVAIARLMQAYAFENDTDVYRLSVADLQAIGFTQHMAQTIVNGLCDKKIIDHELNEIARHRIQIVTIADDVYPALLRAIAVPPAVLYVRGNVPVHNRCLAIVGSRNATAYARSLIDHIMPELAAQHFCIISGGAVGVDSMAHKAALSNAMDTVAVLGSGLLRPYPACNAKLFEQVVAAGGAVISPFALHAQPKSGNFPARNRIVSGLSRGVLVVQAAQRSGALISALYALDQGREVFAVPGPFNDGLSAGCHGLLKQGACLACCAADILAELGIEFSIREVVPKIPVEQDVELTLEQRILNACSQPRSLEDLAEQLAISMQQLYASMLSLQLAGKVQQDFAGLFSCVS